MKLMNQRTILACVVTMLVGLLAAATPSNALGMRGIMVAADFSPPLGGIGSGTNVGPICDPVSYDCWADVGMPTATYVLDCNYPCIALWTVYRGGARLRVTNLDTGETCEQNGPFGDPCHLPRGVFKFELTAQSWGTGAVTSIVFH